MLTNFIFGTLMIFSLESETTIPSVPVASSNINDYKNSSAWINYLSSNRFKTPHENIINEAKYCEIVDLFRSQHKPLLDSFGMPLPLERIIYSDYKPGNLVKEIITLYATQVFKFHFLESESKFPEEKLPYNINMFFHKTPFWHYYHEIGKNFLCKGQMYNHIPGHEYMIYKDESAKSARLYGQKYLAKKHCFYHWDFTPLTVDLSDKDECKAFFNSITLESFNTTNWILKKSRNSHNGEGVTIITKSKLKGLLQLFENGEQCGIFSQHYILQKYIGNPLTIEKRKFDFRLYMLIASVDPLIILYHDGFLRVSLTEYDRDSKESGSHITNTHLALEFVQGLNATEDEKEELLKEQMWTFKDFEEYMVGLGKVQTGWLDLYVRPLMKKNMYHLGKMHEAHLLKHPGVFELYGLDFIFDTDLHLWLLEINRSPAMQATSEEKGDLQGKMIQEILDIEYAILYGADLEKVVEQTTFEMIFNDKKEGMEKYYGLITEECV